MTNKLRTDYAGHDRTYKKRRAENKLGWDDEYETRFAILDAWLEKTHVPRTGRLLELGCGAGNISVKLAEHGFQVVGADIAPAAIEWAKERLRESGLAIEFIEADVTKIEAFVPNSFDVVFDSHCLHCIIGDDRQRLLQSIFQALKPDGILRVDSMCGDTSREDIAALLDLETRNVVSGDLATRYLGHADDIIAEVRVAGFQVVEYEIIPNAVDPDLLLLDCRKPVEFS